MTNQDVLAKLRERAEAALNSDNCEEDWENGCRYAFSQVLETLNEHDAEPVEVTDEMVERVRKAEAERDEAVSKAMVWAKSCADANERVERAEAVIAEALGVVRSGSVPLGVPVARHYDRLLAETRRILSGYERTDQ